MLAALTPDPRRRRCKGHDPGTAAVLSSGTPRSGGQRERNLSSPNVNVMLQGSASSLPCVRIARHEVPVPRVQRRRVLAGGCSKTLPPWFLQLTAAAAAAAW